MTAPCSQTAEIPSTDPNVRPIRSVSFRENAEVLVFAQNDVPMACGPDWDPEQLVYVTEADLMIHLTFVCTSFLILLL